MVLRTRAYSARYHRWMAFACVLLTTAEGARHVLLPTAIIGRLAKADLQLHDPTVSEAHALISLRGGEVRLLALRGGLVVDGVPCREIALRRGQVVEIGAVTLRVTSVTLPTHELALRQGQRLVRLRDAGWLSEDLTVRPTPQQGAPYLYPTDEGWSARWGTGLDVPLHEGDHVGGAAVVLLALSPIATTLGGGRAATDRRLVLGHLVAKLEKRGRTIATFTGQKHDMLLVLAQHTSVEWEDAARGVWGGGVMSDRAIATAKWSKAVLRLKAALVECGALDILRHDAGRYWLDRDRWEVCV